MPRCYSLAYQYYLLQLSHGIGPVPKHLPNAIQLSSLSSIISLSIYGHCSSGFVSAVICVISLRKLLQYVTTAYVLL